MNADIFQINTIFLPNLAAALQKVKLFQNSYAAIFRRTTFDFMRLDD